METNSKKELAALTSRHRKRNLLILAGMAGLLLACMLLSLRMGAYDTPMGEMLKGIFGMADRKVNAVVRGSRLPRICTAVLAGVGLGVTGCILQAILQNPLASSSTLGISQGAGFGAAFAIVVLQAGVGGTVAGMTTISMLSFFSSMLVSLVILGMAKFRGIGPETMVLAGVALSALFSGGTTLMQYFADDVQLTTFLFWTFGDLGSTDWRQIGMIGLVVTCALCFFILRRWDYNALYAGEQTAVSLGVNVKATRLINLIICTFVAATIVSYIGIINFIGLVAPHIVRRLMGEDYCYLIPGSALMGAILLLLGDLVARMLVSPIILPIGAITSFLGAPLFLYLLFKEKKHGGS